jgi:hypothetical protein
VAFVLDMAFDWSDGFWLALLAMAVYGFAMILNFYKQPIWKTLIKFVVLTYAYFMLLTTFIILEILVSLMIF